MEVDKLGPEMTKGNNVRPAMTASLVAVFKALTALEGLYDLPQAGDLPSELWKNSIPLRPSALALLSFWNTAVFF